MVPRRPEAAVIAGLLGNAASADQHDPGYRGCQLMRR
jgi:hypothetical protein